MSDDPLKQTPACEFDRDNRLSVASRQVENLLGIIETVQREKDELRDQIVRYGIERNEIERKLHGLDVERDRLQVRHDSMREAMDGAQWLLKDLRGWLNSHHSEVIEEYDRQRKWEADAELR